MELNKIDTGISTKEMILNIVLYKEDPNYPTVYRYFRRQEMPKQTIAERIKNFNEVALGFEPDQAIIEASRCLQCQDPQCRRGCPVGINITTFCGHVREGNFDKAISVIRESNSLPAISGRVCPQESQCEAYCAMGQTGSPLAIGALERFLADYELKKGIKMPIIAPITGKKVAVIGSGPAGLTVAGDLAKLGHIVSIFEALHTPGGVLAYGTPEFRLPESIVAAEVDYVKRLGAKLETNMVIGKIFTIGELFEWGAKRFFWGPGLDRLIFLVYLEKI